MAPRRKPIRGQRLRHGGEWKDVPAPPSPGRGHRRAAAEGPAVIRADDSLAYPQAVSCKRAG
jgi:hypothetical protein